MSEARREARNRLAPLGPLAVIGVQRWKRPYMRPYLEAGGHPVAFLPRGAAPRAGWRPVVWGAAPCPAGWDPGLLVRMEDGFLHSHGLGSDLVAPLSAVVDPSGIYCDARTPSRLVQLLASHPFDDALRERGGKLRERWAALGLTKYNRGRRPVGWRPPAGRKVVLVPGQVADDASVVHGAAGIRTMEQMLAAVRRRCPRAWIVYRPHPDVASGNRKGLLDAGALADVIDMESDIVSLIDAADEVHALTSLTGFEALLRGREVTTWGRPFYAGWGLTTDSAGTMPFRTRSLTLDELAAAALVLYPLYFDHAAGEFLSPEDAVESMARLAARPAAAEPTRPARLATNAARWLLNVLPVRRRLATP